MQPTIPQSNHSTNFVAAVVARLAFERHSRAVVADTQFGVVEIGRWMMGKMHRRSHHPTSMRRQMAKVCLHREVDEAGEIERHHNLTGTKWCFQKINKNRLEADDAPGNESWPKMPAPRGDWHKQNCEVNRMERNKQQESSDRLLPGHK